MCKKYKTIDISKLEVGDVILTTQNSLTSLLIRFATFSKYSHIAIYVGAGLIFETTPKNGAAYANMKVIRVTDQHTYATLIDAQKIIVCRHKFSASHFPSIYKNFNDWKVYQEKLIYVIGEKWGDEYALLEELAGTVRFFSNPVRYFLKKVGGLYVDRNKLVAGDFCSNLISNIYLKLRITPFSKDITKYPSPQRFLNKNYSHFRIVEGIYSEEEEAFDEITKKTIENHELNNIIIAKNNYVLNQKKTLNILAKINNI